MFAAISSGVSPPIDQTIMSRQSGSATLRTNSSQTHPAAKTARVSTADTTARIHEEHGQFTRVADVCVTVCL